MPKFCKKPVVIEAIRFDGIEDGKAIFATDPTGWLTDAMSKDPPTEGAVDWDAHNLVIFTLEGEHRANKGDWIIKGIQGEIYPCKPDIFTATYEAELSQ